MLLPITLTGRSTVRSRFGVIWTQPIKSTVVSRSVLLRRTMNLSSAKLMLGKFSVATQKTLGLEQPRETGFGDIGGLL